MAAAPSRLQRTTDTLRPDTTCRCTSKCNRFINSQRVLTQPTILPAQAQGSDICCL